MKTHHAMIALFVLCLASCALDGADSEGKKINMTQEDFR